MRSLHIKFGAIPCVKCKEIGITEMIKNTTYQHHLIDDTHKNHQQSLLKSNYT